MRRRIKYTVPGIPLSPEFRRVFEGDVGEGGEVGGLTIVIASREVARQSSSAWTGLPRYARNDKAGGGVRGGEIVAEGTPEEVAKVARSFTGGYLKGMLAK